MAIYQLELSWNMPMVVGSYFISVLGAYTSTQLMCQVGSSHRILKKLSWIGLASISFGGTGIWAMHFVSMLALNVGIPIRYNKPATIASAIIAVIATFVTFSYEILVKELNWPERGRRLRSALFHPTYSTSRRQPSEEGLPLMEDNLSQREMALHYPSASMRRRASNGPHPSDTGSSDANPALQDNVSALTLTERNLSQATVDDASSGPSNSGSETSGTGTASDTFSGYSELFIDEYDLAYANDLRERNERIKLLWAGKNVFGRLIWGLWFSLTSTVIVKGGLLGLTVCAMHYSGMWSMRMDGYITWDMQLVASSVLTAWITCVVAIIYMPKEPNVLQQAVFSLLAAIGVSAMHYVGIASGTFHTTLPPPHNSASMPSDLPFMILIMAVTTCLLSYAMLAHLVTQSRDRLADMMATKRSLWKVIAEKEAFERANRIKSEFISIASHEIRTPLHAISGYTDLLLQTPLTEEQATYLESIKMGCHSIHLITNNVLDFSKLEKGSKESNARPVDVNIRVLALRVVQSCATPHRMSEVQLRRLGSQHNPGSGSEANSLASLSSTPERNVELFLLVEPTVPAVLFVDEVYTTRVVMNLISNALKFTEDGYVLVRVSIDEPKEGDNGPFLAISVRDSGIGIPDDFRTALFEPFTQADTSLTRSHTGAGLGLAISKQLCERMGGTIDLWTKQGTGSEFTIRIPALSGHGQPLAAIESKKPSRKLIALSIAVRSVKTFELLRVLLEKRGFSVRRIDLSHPLRARQPALSKPERLWIEMECLASAPWLFNYVNNLRNAPHDVSCFIIFDEVGTDLGLQTVRMLKEAGQIALVRRPVVFHELETSLRQGVPQTTEEKEGTPEPGAEVSDAQPRNMSSALQGLGSMDVAFSPPIIEPGHMIPSAQGATSSPAVSRSDRVQQAKRLETDSKDNVIRALNPLESVVHNTVAAAKAKRVRFESGQDPQATGQSEVDAEVKRSIAKPVEPKKRKFILLVEDNLVNQKLGIRILQKLSYETELAENGKVALDLVTANHDKYGLVLMDCQMPVMNGFECTRRIRALESGSDRLPRVPIIALTANVSSESREECERAGADHFLAKPLLMEDLKAAIQRYLVPEPTQP